MLWVLPINAPVLLVWAHNLVVHWFMPFSSHHNVLSIMPFLVLVETMTSGAMIPRITTRYDFFLYLQWCSQLIRAGSNISPLQSSLSSPCIRQSMGSPTPTSSTTLRISLPLGLSVFTYSATTSPRAGYGASSMAKSFLLNPEAAI